MPSEAVDRVLMRLLALDCNPKGNETAGWNAKCPAHEDRNPSFKLDQADDGRALVYCHAGCTIDQIASAMALDVRELFEGEALPLFKREIVATYDYLDVHGVLLFQVCRTFPKAFFQRRPDGHGGWINDRKGIPPILYHLPEVLAADKVVICEGEKDADALMALGVVATTNPGGAGKWRDEYVVVFKGKTVACVQHVDPQDKKTGHYPGQEHAEDVRKSFEKAGMKITMLQPAVGNDVHDHLAAGMKLKDLLPASQPRPKLARMEILSIPEIMALPDLDEEGYLLGPVLYKGHRIVIGGWTGHGKTTFVMHMVSAACHGKEFLRAGWRGRTDREVRALVIDVEQGTKTVKRVLRETGLDHSDHVQYLRVPDGLALDSDEEAIAFMEKSFAKGRFDIVLADPLYKLHRGDPNDTRAATELMRRFDDWRERFGFALILPMHCRKPQGDRGAPKLSPHDLFGSSAYQWGAEMLLGVERKKPGMTWVHWWKDREGDAAEDGATVGSHWPIIFDRKRGFGRYVEGKQERLEIDTEPTPRFELSDFCYELIRETGAVTREDVKTALYRKGVRWAGGMKAIDNALSKLGHRGVYEIGAPLKKDRVYQLQSELLNEDPGAANAGATSTRSGHDKNGGDADSSAPF
jgi:hypothetical protein